MNKQDWAEQMKKLAQWHLADFSSGYIEVGTEPGPIDKLKGIYYRFIYSIVYYPIRLAYLTWDGIEDAFNDAWGRF